MSRRVAPAFVCVLLSLVLVVWVGLSSEVEIPLPEGAVARLGLGQIAATTVFSPDGRYLAIATSLGVELRDAVSLELVRFFHGHTRSVVSVAFSPDGRTLASGSLDETIKLWDIETGRELRILTGHTSSVYPVAFSPDGRTLVSGSLDKTIKLWDVATGEELRTLAEARWVNSVAYSPDGRTLASESRWHDQVVEC